MTTTAAEIAGIIRSQISVGVFMSIGATDLMYQNEPAGLTFRARIHPDGYSSARVMRVTITLNAWDLYDVTVVWSKTKYSEILTHRSATGLGGVDAEQLNRWLLELDKREVSGRRPERCPASGQRVVHFLPLPPAAGEQDAKAAGGAGQQSDGPRRQQVGV